MLPAKSWFLSTRVLLVQALRAGMVATGTGGVGNDGTRIKGTGGGGRGYRAGCGAERTGGGGGGARGGRHGYGVGYGYDDGANYNGPRFNPNLRTHPPHYGPG